MGEEVLAQVAPAATRLHGTVFGHVRPLVGHLRQEGFGTRHARPAIEEKSCSLRHHTSAWSSSGTVSKEIPTRLAYRREVPTVSW